MSVNDYLALVKRTNPKLWESPCKIQITTTSLEEVIRNAFEAGRKLGFHQGSSHLPPSSLFDAIFGKR